jgi:hypothetical protein
MHISWQTLAFFFGNTTMVLGDNESCNERTVELNYDHLASSETSLFLLGVMGCNGDMIKYDKMVVYSRIQAKQVEFN